MNSPLFLLGAGFNKDAKEEAGPICEYGTSIECDYPLLNDLWHICYPEEKQNENILIENKIAEDLNKGKKEPLKLLCDEILKCDQYLIPRLYPKKTPERLLRGQNPNNRAKIDELFLRKFLNRKNSETCYSKFFKKFQKSSFLTFNYDAIPECFLLNMDIWYPEDGFGVPVKVEIDNFSDCENSNKQNKSSIFVIHLHGSLYVYISEFFIKKNKGEGIDELKIRPVPEYRFDPDVNANLFTPYKACLPDVCDYNNIENLENRIIAPVPNKAEGLKGEYIKSMYSKANELLSKTNLLIIIGYNFNKGDESSFEVLLRKFSTQTNPKILLISPDYQNIKNRLNRDYPSIEWINISPMTFKEWVEKEYIGVSL